MTQTPPPGQIENDIYVTQDRMSQTFDELSERLNPMSLLRSLFASEGGGNSEAWDRAKRNPLALGMIAAGAAWLFSDHDARPGAFKGHSGDSSGNRPSYGANVGEPIGYQDPHTAYVGHMAAVEQRESEPWPDYQRRRDTARGTYLMIERQHDEDDHGYRARLDRATEQLRERSHAFGQRMRDTGRGARDHLSNAASSASGMGSSAARRGQDLFTGNPLVSGLIAAAFGAAAGASAPMSHRENDMLGQAGETARQNFAARADEATDLAEEKIESNGSGRSEARPAATSTF